MNLDITFYLIGKKKFNIFFLMWFVLMMKSTMGL